MNLHYRSYHEFLLEKLKNPQLALAYLREAFNDKDQRMFILALNNVLEAQGGNLSAIIQAAQQYEIS